MSIDPIQSTRDNTRFSPRGGPTSCKLGGQRFNKGPVVSKQGTPGGTNCSSAPVGGKGQFSSPFPRTLLVGAIAPSGLSYEGWLVPGFDRLGSILQQLSGLSLAAYLTHFNRLYLSGDGWDKEQARQCAESLANYRRHEWGIPRIIAIGARTRSAFGLNTWYQWSNNIAAIKHPTKGADDAARILQESVKWD